MSASFGVRPSRPEDRPAILALLAQVWGASDGGREVLARLDAQWEWRFVRNPAARSSLPPGLVLERGDAIVGHVSCTPVRVSVRGAEVEGFWSGEWVTDPERARGFGHLLVRRLMALPALGLATPNDLAHAALTRLGWSHVCHLERRVRVVCAERVLAGVRGASLLGRAAGWALRAAASAAAPRRRAEDAGLRVVAAPALDDRFDALWRRVAPGYGAAVVRDRRFLAWRYLEIPGRAYSIAAAERGGELAGYVVFYARRRGGLVFGHVIDLLVERGDAGARDALLAHAAEELGRRGVDVVTCYLSPYDAFVRSGLRRCGFFFARRGVAVLTRDGAPARGVGRIAPGEWFVSRGDSDLDMAS